MSKVEEHIPSLRRMSQDEENKQNVKETPKHEESKPNGWKMSTDEENKPHVKHVTQPAEHKPNVRKLQTSVSYDPSEDEDFNSVANSDFDENSTCLKRNVEFVSVTVDDDSKQHPEKTNAEKVERTAEQEANASNGKLNSELTSFVQKKSFAQNMMDIALLSANTNQLRYVIDLGNKHPYYSTSLCLIILSLVMQVVVGLSMLYMSRYNMKNKSEMKEASHMNNLSVAGVFLVTLVNVFISTFNGTGGEGLLAPVDPVVANNSEIAAYILP